MSAVNRLIADRGHGLSRVQLDAIRWLGTDGRAGSAPRRVATWEALERLGAVEHRPEVGEFFGYRLTPDGVSLARRQGIEAPYPTPEHGAEADRLREIAIDCAEDAAWKRREDR